MSIEEERNFFFVVDGGSSCWAEVRDVVAGRGTVAGQRTEGVELVTKGPGVAGGCEVPNL